MRLRLAAAALFLLVPALRAQAPAAAPAVPISRVAIGPTSGSGVIGQLVAKILEEAHYDHHPIDKATSRHALRNFLDDLDYDHLIFEKADVDGFEASYADSLGDRLKDGDVSPAFTIFNAFTKRLQEREAFVQTLGEKDFDFSADDWIQLDRHKAPWPASAAEADKLWRLKVKSELLQERLNKAKPEERDKTVRLRYERLLRSVLEYDSGDVLELYLTALAHTFDPHSDYLAASQKENFDISMRLSLVGIGAVLRSEDGYAKIVSLVPGGPADVDKRLKPNDRIEAVAQADGPFEEVVGMKLDKVVGLIRGTKATQVRLRVIPADAVNPTTRVVVSLTRDEIKLTNQEARAKIVEVPGLARSTKVGVIDLPSFYSDMKGSEDSKSTTRDLAKLIGYLSKKDVEGLVIDLRRNGGGSLAEAVSLTELFIKEGPVVQVKDSAGAIKLLSTTDSDGVYSGPVVVLTSRMSASASEIFAGALQDYGRAVVVGEKSTFGKGTVQSLLSLADYLPPDYRGENPGALKITIQKFYRVSGASTQNRGVIPDIHLPAVEDVMDVAESSLDDALPYDEVAPASFRPIDEVGSALPRLRSDSSARVAASPEFAYIREDTERMKKDMKDKLISLNEKKRLAELKSDESRDETRKKERLKRKSEEFKTTDVTLESIDGAPVVPAAPLDATAEAPAPSTGPAAGAYERAPPAPDVAFDESVRILCDLIRPPVETAPSAASAAEASHPAESAPADSEASHRPVFK